MNPSSSVPNSLDENPFRRAGLLKRIGPFAFVAVLADASVALPPGPTSNNYAITSAVLLVATGDACLLPGERLSTDINVIAPLLYVATDRPHKNVSMFFRIIAGLESA